MGMRGHVDARRSLVAGNEYALEVHRRIDDIRRVGARSGPAKNRSAALLVAAIANSTQGSGRDPLASHTWFLRYARVRDPLARLSA
jgi:hypothetical protein